MLRVGGTTIVKSQATTNEVPLKAEFLGDAGDRSSRFALLLYVFHVHRFVRTGSPITRREGELLSVLGLADRLVVSDVGRLAGEQLQVVDRIVRPVSVDVVNALRAGEGATQVASHDHAMLKAELPTHPDQAVTARSGDVAA